MKEVKDLIRRIKNLALFEVTTDLPADFEFSGRVPYDLKIKNGVVTLKIFAVTRKEAERKAQAYLQGEYNG